MVNILYCMSHKNRMVSLVAVAGAILMSFSYCPYDNTVKRRDVMVAAWERAKLYTKEYLEAATEEVYGFKPTAEMRTFGEQMHHLAVDNYKIVGAAVTGRTST